MSLFSRGGYILACLTSNSIKICKFQIFSLICSNEFSSKFLGWSKNSSCFWNHSHHFESKVIPDLSRDSVLLVIPLKESVTTLNSSLLITCQVVLDILFPRESSHYIILLSLYRSWDSKVKGLVFIGSIPLGKLP